MNKINAPISIIEFGSSNIKIAIYDKLIFSQNVFYQEKINFTKNNNSITNYPISNLIIKIESKLGTHLNEIILLIDSSKIYSIDFSIQKVYDNKIIIKEDIDYQINQCVSTIKSNNPSKTILHVLKSKISFDNKVIPNIENISQKASKVTIELKFILIDKSICDEFRNIFYKNHISISKIWCATYIKSLGLINNNDISGFSSFIDIGFKKSSLTIYKDNNLLYLDNTHIGGHHITQDISKILQIDYRKAESLKLKFSKNIKLKKDLSNFELLKNIINSRIEEIVELLFFNCPLYQNKFFNGDFKLFFTGNGSRVLNKNLLTFGPEFNFINEMSIIQEEKNDTCNSAFKFHSNIENKNVIKTNFNLENKGFFEKLFDYFTKR